MIYGVSGVAGAVLLGAVASQASEHSLTIAAVVCMLPLVPYLICRPTIAAVAAIAVLPFGSNLLGGRAGLQVGAPDLLLALTFVGLIIRLGSNPAYRVRLKALRPLLPPIVVYLAVAFVQTVANASFQTSITVVQRFELVGVPLMIGATLLTERTAWIALRLFVIAGLVIATTALIHHQVSGSFLGVQKNPAGQFVADAALLVLATVKRQPIRVLLFSYLVLGMYFTYSRGAITGILAGLALLLLLNARNFSFGLLRVGLGAAVAISIFSILPGAAQDRLLGNVQTTTFNDQIRHSYISDAETIIDQHPIFGVGLGNYIAGDPAKLTQTNDPHNVVLLEAAEGGYPLIVAFTILQLGALILAGRRRARNRWMPLAVAVQASILVHALVDVYWVRGTPVIGWLFVGMAFSMTLSKAAVESTGRHSAELTAPREAHIVGR